MYVMTNWVQRIRQYANRIVLTATGGANEYDVAQVEGTVTQVGIALSPTNMNKMEQGILDAHNMASVYIYKNIGGAL